MGHHEGFHAYREGPKPMGGEASVEEEEAEGEKIHG